MNNSNIRVVSVSVSPENFINWNLLYAVGKIKAKEEVVDVFDVTVTKDKLIEFKVKVRKE